MNINSLLPQDGRANQNAAAIALERKWERTGLLEGLSSEVERKGMAVLLENQAKQLVTEASATGGNSNSEEWSGVALPLVRRIFAEIAAKDFVSVQPMNLPSGLVFYLDFKYGTAVNQIDQAGGNDFLTGQGKDAQSDSVFGITDARKGTPGTEGLYGPGRFGYSVNMVEGASVTLGESGITTARTGSISATTGLFTSTAASAGDAMTATELGIFTNFNSEFSASVHGDNHVILSVPSKSLHSDASVAARYDQEAVRSFNLSGSNAFYPEFTRTTANGSHIEFLIKKDADIKATSAFKVSFALQPSDITRGDYEDQAPNEDMNGSTSLNIPEINLEMRSEAIVAKTRKLKAVWTPEFAQDLNAYHSIDAEAELTSMLSEYVSQEIDLEILGMLQENAQTVERWSAKVGYEYNAAVGGFNAGNSAAQAYNQGTWFQTLGTKIQKVSNKIHQLTLRGGANFLVCSPTVATILESIPGYAADTDGDKMQFAMGVQKVGSINSRFQVYKNPYMTENSILMGYRGSQFLETGAVYSPYIPLIMTPLVYDPDNFTPRKGVMTRYAKKIVRPEFYGKVLVHGLDTI
tara:strand:- start:2842 stop:4578 length:1737 start_codon:yes stop_codon:yes gene_type:complete